MTAIESVQQGPTLTYEVRIQAPPALVWRYWTEPERMVRWMGDVATLEPRPGGTFRLEYGSGDVVAGAYVEVDPPRHLVLTWGWDEAGALVPPGASRIQLDLDPLDDGAATLLRLRHLDLPEPSRISHDEGWRYFLPRLVEAAAEG